MFNVLSNVIQNAVDTVAPPVPLLEDLIYHWNVLEKQIRNSKKEQKINVETTKILLHLDQILRIIKQEVTKTKNDDLGPCIEYVIQYKLLDVLVDSSRKDCPSGIIQHTLKFTKELVESFNRMILGNVGINFPLKKLIKICGFIKASPYEVEEVDLICSICKKLMSEPTLVPCFLDIERGPSNIMSDNPNDSVQIHKKSSFPIINALMTLCLSEDYTVSKKAAVSLADCLSLSEPFIANHCMNSNMCHILVSHLIDLFLCIPDDIHSEILEETSIIWNDTDFNGSDVLDSNTKICLFKYSWWLSYIDHLISTAQPLISEELAKCVKVEFFSGILEPLVMSSDPLPAGHLIKLVKQINSSILLSEFAYWLLGDNRSAELKGLPLHPAKEALMNYGSSSSHEVFVDSLKLFQELLSKPCEHIIYSLVLANLSVRSYYNVCGENHIDSWSDEEDERVKRRDEGDPLLSKDYCISRTLAPASIQKIINSFLEIVPDNLKSCDDQIEAAYENYIQDASKQFKLVLSLCSNFGWPRESTTSENISETSSSDSRPEADSEKLFYEGAFLSAIFDRVSKMYEQSYEMNLELTSVIAKLALLPHPHLHEYLLNPFIPLVVGTRTLYGLLVGVMDVIKEKICAIENPHKKLLTIRNKLLNEEMISMNEYSDDEVTLFESLIVIEEFSKELAAIAYVKYQYASSSPYLLRYH